jgi:hypothetical protein
MNADKDGVVEGYTVLKKINVPEDNFRVLLAKNFIIKLNEDDVSFITDWHEHNLIRADRKIDSIYKELLLKIVPDAQILEPKPRADTGVIPRQLPAGRPLDGIGKGRIGKDSISKIHTKNNSKTPIAASGEGKIINDFIDLFKGVNPSWERLFAQKGQREAVQRMIKIHGPEKLKWTIEQLPKTNAIKFAPTITTPYELEKNLGKLIAYFQKRKSESDNKKIITL